MSIATGLPQGVKILGSPPAPKQAIWTYRRVWDKIVIPSGTYYVGDCAAMLSNENYEAMCKIEERGAGLFFQGDEFFFRAGVYYGSGSYTSYYRASDGKKFRCSSGGMGVGTLGLVKESDWPAGHVYTFDTETTCDGRGGVFLFHNDKGEEILRIDTHEWITAEEFNKK